jgi:hypothetical protein
MSLPFHHNTLGGLRVVDAGRAASSTKPVNLSWIDALPIPKWWIFIVFDRLLFYFDWRSIGLPSKAVESAPNYPSTIDSSKYPTNRALFHLAVEITPNRLTEKETIQRDSIIETKSSTLNDPSCICQHRCSCPSVRKLTVGVGVLPHEQEMGDLTRILSLFHDSRKSWHFRSIKRSSDTFGLVLWTPYAVLPWVVWGSCALFLAGNLNNLKYWFLCSNHPNQILLDATKPTSHIH